MPSAIGDAMRFLIALLFVTTLPAFCAVFPMPAANQAMLGKPSTYIVKHGDSFEKIARRFGVGPLNIIEANPGLDPLLPPPGTRITLPTALLVPNVERKGIVINLAELRLYYFDNSAKKLYVFPVGIGRIGLDTPLGVTKIVQKEKNPTWTPTQGTRDRFAAEGKTLPDVVPAGPDNPLGLFAMRMGFGHGEYLIHGTNQDVGIGMRVSAGCIRLEPKDIESLFGMVPAGTQVRIINEPVKTAKEPDGRFYMEVHKPLSRTGQDTQVLTLSRTQQRQLSEKTIDDSKVREALRLQPGVPQLVGWLN